MNRERAIAVAIPKEDGLRAYVAATYFDRRHGIYLAQICFSKQPSKEALPSPKPIGNSVKCPGGTTELK